MSARPFLLLAPLAILAACATSGPAVDGRQPANVDAVVDMTPVLRFSPNQLKIKAGDTVEFRNISAFTHTVSSRASAIPAGAAPFNSGQIKGGGTYRHTFTVPGTYNYFCDPHQGAGMTGVIVVSAS